MNVLVVYESLRGSTAAIADGIGPSANVMSTPLMRTWLSELPRGQGRFAVFDTRVQGRYGRGATSKIARALQIAGYHPIGRPHGSYVTGHPWKPATNVRFRKVKSNERVAGAWNLQRQCSKTKRSKTATEVSGLMTCARASLINASSIRKKGWRDRPGLLF